MWYTNMADSNSCYASGHVGEKTLYERTYLSKTKCTSDQSDLYNIKFLRVAVRYKRNLLKLESFILSSMSKLLKSEMTQIC